MSVIPLERIGTEARALDPRRVLLTIIATPLFVLGWLIAKAARALWLVVAWLWTAAQVGWREGWASRPPDGG